MQRVWWGSLVAYVNLLVVAYTLIWKWIAPLGLPDVFPSGGWLFNTRWFFHIVVAVLVAAHGTIALDLSLRRGLWRPAITALPSVTAHESREAIYGAVVATIAAVEADPGASRTLSLERSMDTQVGDDYLEIERTRHSPRSTAPFFVA